MIASLRVRLERQTSRRTRVQPAPGDAATMFMPLLAIATRSPRLGAVLFILGAGGIAIGTLVHLMSLPVEWNASFGRALPVLTRGGYISDRQS